MTASPAPAPTATRPLTLRPAQERGQVSLDWLQSAHSFSFGHYYDPQHLGFSSLRVINEDVIQPGKGFGTHGHQDMEIVTYVLSGSLRHQDSLGNGSVIRPGDVQRMTAGTGIFHSEFNDSDRDLVHLLQIWIVPDTLGLEPGYEEIQVPAAEKQGQLRLLASRDGRSGSVVIHQDASLYGALLSPSETVTYEGTADRSLWLQVARGALTVTTTDRTGTVANASQALQAGDGLAIAQGMTLTLEGEAAADTAEILLFDLPGVR
ncbi:MAG: pirin family protein [Prochlorothrix sp.]